MIGFSTSIYKEYQQYMPPARWFAFHVAAATGAAAEGNHSKQLLQACSCCWE
jgi:hypothetical protein